MLGIAIRYGHESDIDAIAGLLETSRAEVSSLFERGDFLVLDREPGGLAGSLFIRVEEGRARLDLLSVEAGAGPDLERRLLEVAEMLSQAKGCSALELRIGSGRSVRTLCQEMGFHPTTERGGVLEMEKPISW